MDHNDSRWFMMIPVFQNVSNGCRLCAALHLCLPNLPVTTLLRKAKQLEAPVEHMHMQHNIYICILLYIYISISSERFETHIQRFKLLHDKCLLCTVIHLSQQQNWKHGNNSFTLQLAVSICKHANYVYASLFMQITRHGGHWCHVMLTWLVWAAVIQSSQVCFLSAARLQSILDMCQEQQKPQLVTNKEWYHKDDTITRMTTKYNDIA